MNKNYKSIIAVCATVTVMITIFMFSSRNGSASSNQSIRVTRLLCRVIFVNYKDMSAEQKSFVVKELHHFVRKLAHFSIYMLLGVCTYSSILLGEFRIKKKWTAALGICMIYAVLDEIHQYFIPGRAMSARDVCIDSAGALIGIIAVRVIVIVFTYALAYNKKSRSAAAAMDGRKNMK